MATPQYSTPLVALDAVAIDTETTGLDVRTARLVQFGGVHIRGGAVSCKDPLSALVDPGVPIPPEASRIHGITDKHVAGATRFAALAPTIDTFLESAIVIGHAIAYDMAVLEREYRLADLAWTPPRTLDVGQLARLAAPTSQHRDLDRICSALGIEIEDRHTALGDAFAAARAFVGLIPLLRARGLRTLAEVEAAIHDLTTNDAQNGGLMVGEERSAAPPNALMKVDSFPYRHSVRDVMSAPVVTASGATSLRDAALLLLEKRISSVFVPSDEHGVGIVTERDVLKAVATGGAAALDKPIDTIATRPVHTIDESAFVYRAIGRMDRLSIRHLGVVDREGALVGALTTRNLLRHRATTAMMLGDQIDSAEDVPPLAQAWSKLPPVARLLLEEEIDARLVAAVVSSEICAVARRAAVIGERRLAEAGRGPPPVEYSLMVLGSAGRGESLLAADQDHAIVYSGGESDGTVDRWFKDLGEEISNILDAVGIPFCKGGVMSQNAAWRMSEAGWRDTIERWVRRQRPEDLLNVDIFFDAIAVHGSQPTVDNLLDHAYEIARGTPSFIALLSDSARRSQAPLTLFRNLRTDRNGRIDLKLNGLLPLVSGARVLAIKHGIRARPTPHRLRALIDGGYIGDSDGNKLIDAHGTLVTALLAQQLMDSEQGTPLSSRVAPERQPPRVRAALKDAVLAVDIMSDLVSEGRF